MRIALGTVSKQKKKFLEKTMEELEIPTVVDLHQVLSDISDRLGNDDEVKESSVKRAKKALDEDKKADFSLGIECGYGLDSKGNYEMFCWATLIDKNGKRISARSKKLLTSVFSEQKIKKQKKIIESVRQFVSKNLNSFIYTPCVEPVNKESNPMIQEAIKTVISDYLMR